jgi:hypothetical protein
MSERLLCPSIPRYLISTMRLTIVNYRRVFPSDIANFLANDLANYSLISGEGLLLLDLEPQRLGDLGTGETLRTLKSHTSTINAVALTPDGRHAVSALDCPKAAATTPRFDPQISRRTGADRRNVDAALIVAFRRLAPFLAGCSARTSWVFLVTSGTRSVAGRGSRPPGND